MENVSCNPRRHDIGIIRRTSGYESIRLLDARLDQNITVESQTMNDTALEVGPEAPNCIVIVVNDRDIVPLPSHQLADLRADPSTTHDRHFHKKLPPLLHIKMSEHVHV